MIGRAGEAGFTALGIDLAAVRSARRRLAWGNPGVPHLVHAREIGEIGQEDLRHQDARLVRARATEKPVDRREHLPRLPANVLCCVFRNLARQIGHAVVDGHFGQAGSDIESFHHFISC